MPTVQGTEETRPRVKKQSRLSQGVPWTLGFSSLGFQPVAPSPCDEPRVTFDPIIMRHINRKATPKVVDGRVQKKNNPEWTANYYGTPPPALVIDRQRPGKGYRHVLMQRDIETFIALLPEWAELIARPERHRAGTGRADDRRLARTRRRSYLRLGGRLMDRLQRRPLRRPQAHFDRLGVRSHPVEKGVMCEFTEAQARAYQLLHILLHELGHHHDRMTTKSKDRASRGEPFAEAYALKHEAIIWERYLKAFDL